jgi:hypothetical protein
MCLLLFTSLLLLASLLLLFVRDAHGLLLLLGSVVYIPDVASVPAAVAFRDAPGMTAVAGVPSIA